MIRKFMLTVTYIVMMSFTAIIDIFIGSRSDHCLASSVTAESLLVLNFAQLVGFVIVVIKWISFLVVTRISLCCYMDLTKLLQGFP